jgi:hypothetical protein
MDLTASEQLTLIAVILAVIGCFVGWLGPLAALIYVAQGGSYWAFAWWLVVWWTCWFPALCLAGMTKTHKPFEGL